MTASAPDPEFDASAAERLVSQAWERRDSLAPGAEPELEEAVARTLDALDAGALRVAEPPEDAGEREAGRGTWRTQAWLKQAILLSFRLRGEFLIEAGAEPGGPARWWDKVPSKFAGWDEERFRKAGFRAVPGCWVRRSAYIAPGAVLMPSFVNVGAHVGAGTMVDTWATVGSCAQVGAGCHISGGAGIGGVLEPLQAAPVVIEDDVFVGARSEVVEGVVVRRGAVLSMGVYIGATTKIVERATGEVSYGEVPPYAVVVPGTLPAKPAEDGGPPRPSLYCAVIIKRVDERTRSRTSLNELLRD